MSENGNQPIVQVENVRKVYQQGKLDVQALDGVTFEIAAGEFMALSGPSGSGKTTALNLIGALDAPTSGSIVLEGHDLGSMSRKELSRLRREPVLSNMRCSTEIVWTCWPFITTTVIACGGE